MKHDFKITTALGKPIAYVTVDAPSKIQAEQMLGHVIIYGTLHTSYEGHIRYSKVPPQLGRPTLK